ncbi:hypothetical protein CDAR_121711 [Caerostris darwini]|uniref:Uncharacterized protein n=1 Tax=Caerostris darwini TaxID=1538125 RepID=A0AAV4PAB0_9ARAC|nr:hypothetical protein CDAR_121711 [Caerostris darwini]
MRKPRTNQWESSFTALLIPIPNLILPCRFHFFLCCTYSKITAQNIVFLFRTLPNEQQRIWTCSSHKTIAGVSFSVTVENNGVLTMLTSGRPCSVRLSFGIIIPQWRDGDVVWGCDTG